MQTGLRIRIAACIGLALALAAARAETNDQQQIAEYRAGVNPFVEHAPLAYFSLGSLAVGAAFWGIQSSMGNDRVQAMAGDKSQMDAAIYAAGATAVISGLTYLYYAHRDAKRAREWEKTASRVSAGVTPQGAVRLAATLPLPPSLGL